MRKEACGAGKFPLGLRGTGIDNTLAGLLACRAATLAEAACFLFTGICRLAFAADRRDVMLICRNEGTSQQCTVLIIQTQKADMDVGVARSHHWCARRRVGCHAKQVITIWQLQLAVMSHAAIGAQSAPW